MPMTRPVPQIAIDFIKREETCVLHVYDDARPTHVLAPGDTIQGTLTAGYGHTGQLSIGQPVTLEDVDGWLSEDLGIAAYRLSGVIGDVVDLLTENQYAALLSFVFNLGANPSWTIWKRLKAKQFDQVPLEMMKFVNAGGKKLAGLVKRRADEVELWSKDEPGSEPVTLPSSVTRATATPPTPADPTPPSKTGHIIAAGVTVAASVPAGADKAIHAIAPYADKSEWLQHIVTALAVVAAIGAIATLVFAWLHKRKAQS